MSNNTKPFKNSYKVNQFYQKTQKKLNKIVIDFTTNPQKCISNILTNHNCSCQNYFRSILQIFFQKLIKLRSEREFFKQQVKDLQKQLKQIQTLDQQKCCYEQSFPLTRIDKPDIQTVSRIEEVRLGSFLSDREIYKIEQSKIDSRCNLYQKILQNQCEKQLKNIEKKYNLTESELRRIVDNLKGDKQKTSGSETNKSLKLDENILFADRCQFRLF